MESLKAYAFEELIKPFLNPLQLEQIFLSFLKKKIDCLLRKNYYNLKYLLLTENVIDNVVINQVLDDMLKDHVIDELDFSNLKETITFRFEMETKKPINKEVLVKNYLKSKGDFFEYGILSILSNFKQIDLVGQLKIQKLLYLISKVELRRIAIEKIIILKNMRTHRDDENIVMMEVNAAPCMNYQHYYNGPYDITTKPFVEYRLIKTGLLEIEPKGNMEKFKLTSKGHKKVDELKQDSIEYLKYDEIASLLSQYFDNMNGSELESFIKTYVQPDWNKIKFGEYY